MGFFEKHSYWGAWFLRLGVAATLWYAAWQHSQHLDETVKMLGDLKIPGASPYLAWALIAFLVIEGLALVLRFWQKRFAFLLAVFFVITLITVPWSEPGAVWKDMAFLGAALWWLF